MNLFSLLGMEPLSFSFILTSLIIGVLVLIILEKRKDLKTEEVRKEALRNTTSATLQPAQEDVTSSTESSKDTVIPKEENSVGQPENSAKDTLQEPASSSSCSSSGSEEEASRPLRVPRRPKKKHACKGSAILCATKRKVTAVTIITDSEEEEVKVSLEDLAGEIRSHGVTCDVHPAITHTLPSLSTEPSHLLLLFGTMSKGCERLQESLTSALGGGAAALPPPQPFLYSVTCWSAAAAGDVYESARKLSASLQACGGAEWLPITCITTAEGEGESEPPVMARQQYVKTVMDKLTKPGKKCCGTSCGSKTVDIEDLASSLLLSRTAVTS